MPSREEIQRGHELAILNLFAAFYSALKGSTFRLVERPDPPDGVLQSEPGEVVWVEIADVYRSVDEAHEERSRLAEGESAFIHKERPIVNCDERMAIALAKVIETKICKASYQAICVSYGGPGILICCERDPLFDESTLAEINETIEAETERLVGTHKGFFKEVYLYQSPSNGRPGIFHKILDFPLPASGPPMR